MQGSSNCTFQRLQATPHRHLALLSLAQKDTLTNARHAHPLNDIIRPAILPRWIDFPMASGPSLSTCCLKNFQWTGTPTGKESKLASNNAYITGANPHAALLYIHDALGWNFTNARLLADHFATEADLTVFLPDFFGGEELDKQAILEARWSDLDMDGFRKRNARAVREPEILAAARALRDLGFAKVGVVGYCFGGVGGARPRLRTSTIANPTRRRSHLRAPVVDDTRRL